DGMRAACRHPYTTAPVNMDARQRVARRGDVGRGTARGASERVVRIGPLPAGRLQLACGSVGSWRRRSGQGIADVGYGIENSPLAIECAYANGAPLVESEAGGLVCSEVFSPALAAFFICHPEPARFVVRQRGVRFISRGGGRGNFPAPGARPRRGAEVD